MNDQTIKIAVFAGHGGTDPGAVSGSLKEKDFTLKAADALALRLKTMGYTVVRDRTADVDSGISAKCAKANAQEVSALCELHLNAGGGTGTEAWYADGSVKGKALAEKVSSAVAALGYQNRGAKNDKTCRFGSFGILRGSRAPAVLAELCFLDSKSDMARFDADKLAGAVAGALSAFCPLPAKPVKPPPAPAPKERFHTVVKGDSLWAIAARYLGSGARYPEIKTLNGLKSSVIMPGQRLKIPL